MWFSIRKYQQWVPVYSCSTKKQHLPWNEARAISQLSSLLLSNTSHCLLNPMIRMKQPCWSSSCAWLPIIQNVIYSALSTGVGSCCRCLPFPSLLFFFTDMFGVRVGDSGRGALGFFPEIKWLLYELSHWNYKTDIGQPMLSLNIEPTAHQI